MKKIFYLASIAALAFSSCAKDETTQAAIEDAKGGSKIVAAMEADDTRTHLETTNGKDFEYRWSLGDQLGIYGYGENTLSNAAFVLDNASDNSPVGVFTSQHKLDPKSSYMAVYPRFAEPLFHVASSMYVDDPSTTNVNEAAYKMISKTNGASVTMKILPEQKYQDETFYTTTAPAISGTFAVNADGEAAIGMQPVADYLMVNLTSTEPVKTLTLKLRDEAASKWLKISGESNLVGYWMNGADGMEYRYYIPEGGAAPANFAKKLDGETITIKTDESYQTVTCHEPNTYVFTIPAGILGMGGQIAAYIWVNDTTAVYENAHFVASASKPSALKNLQGYNTSFQLNSAAAKVDNKNPYDRIDETKTGYKQIVKKLENTVFWVNEAIDTDKDKIRDTRTSFQFNPNGDVIIEHEGQLLEYITEYNKGTDGFADKDAFLCSGATFDFSLKNMMELATELENTKYETYIAAYLADVKNGGGFPCFVEYHNNFIGNGAVIENIEQPLLSFDGIFGGGYYGYSEAVILPVSRGGEFVDTKDGGASITNVTFANINAKTVLQEIDYVAQYGGIYSLYKRGHVLAGNFGGDIKNVTVENANGNSIMGVMRVAQYKGMNIEEVSNLYHIANQLVANASLDLTETWSEVSGVEYNVFDLIVPNNNAKNEPALHVITIPEGDGAAYATLTGEVYVDTDSAVAVVIDDVSYWTGDKFKASTADANCVDKNATDYKYYYFGYAEQLANHFNRKSSKDPYLGATLTRDMDMNFANLVRYNSNGSINHADSKYWKTGDIKAIDGAGHTIKGITMYRDSEDLGGRGEYYGPFLNVNVLKNLTIDGVNITLVTKPNATLPEYISGFAAGQANTVADVTLKNFVINGYRADGTGNTQPNYATNYSVKVGYVASTAGNAHYKNVKVEGVESNITAIYGVVGRAKVTDSATTNGSARFENVTVANIETPAADLTKFAQFDPDKYNYNVAGTVVGLAVNGADRKVDFKFVNCNEPIFLFDAENPINVVYNNISKFTLENEEEM